MRIGNSMCAELKKQIAYAIKKLRILYVIYDSNGHYYSLVQLFQRVRRGALPLPLRMGTLAFLIFFGKFIFPEGGGLEGV